MDVVLAGDLDAAERRRWHAALAPALAARCPGVRLWDEHDAFDPAAIEAAVVANPAPGTLAAWPNLKLVHSLWAGVDRLLADAALPARVPLVRMVDPAMNDAMAQTVVWAVLALHRGFFAYARRQRERQWRVHAQRRADEVTVTLLGLGQMGLAAARRLMPLGYRVQAWTLHAHPAADDGIVRAAGRDALEPLLRTSDVVVNLLPLTPATRGLIDARFLAALPKGAGLVNVARGAHVVDADLLAALDSGHLRDAVLDVFATEPLPPGHPYWTHPRVTLLPHAAALTDERSAADVVAANLAAWRAGRAPQALPGWVDHARGY
ncbi:2-hydroxyacid dehydrogenase [Azohydromonas sediminis]|uniref:2-hydroxyacid dehydrogenase n=1 Tax=Azohydromonas sediminis TaxID=2259674 RepID=UPI000E656245|nr:glyoxylate/hydroxypyruvate reductase A [Azohydromonas sediminis]